MRTAVIVLSVISSMEADVFRDVYYRVAEWTCWNILFLSYMVSSMLLGS